MTLTDLASPTELTSFINTNSVCVVTFSAHWCGPCKASKPQLEAIAKDAPMPFGYVYESDLEDFLHTFSIRAFPTYVCFSSGKEVQRVEGVNFPAIQEMISAHGSSASGGGDNASMPDAGGTALGGGGAAVSPEEARRQRLARFGAGQPKQEEPAKPKEAEPAAVVTVPAPAAATPMDMEEPKKEEDATMTDAEEEPSNPVDDLNAEAIKTLTESMGFPLIRAQKGLLFSTGGTVESAVEWLMEHQDDADIDEAIPAGAGAKAQSYKCNECGKILSNMANLELHANKTGHSDFEESTKSVKPLTPEEKAAKILQIKELLKSKRAEREETEKDEQIELEKQRRSMGKEMSKTREQMDAEQRKRDVKARKREKDETRRERTRIKAELEKDKRERIANKGKLLSRLGVDGYNPDAIQYERDDGTEEPAPQKGKTTPHHADVAKIDEYIKKVSSYRASGDGAKCLKILKAYVGNVADNPGEDKFKNINMDNKAYKTKVKPFVGAKHLLMAVGFGPKDDDPTHLTLKDGADPQVLKDTKEKLEKALIAFG